MRRLRKSTLTYYSMWKFPVFKINEDCQIVIKTHGLEAIELKYAYVFKISVGA